MANVEYTLHDDVVKRTLLWTRQYILRLVLNTSSTSQPMVHHSLKKATFSYLPSTSGAFPVKCVFDVALMSLLDDGLLTRCGHGNWARYTVPHELVRKVMRVAYAEFTPDSWYDDDYSMNHGVTGGEGNDAVAAAGDACDVPMSIAEYGSGCRSPRRMGKRDRYTQIGSFSRGGKAGNVVSLSVAKRVPHHKRRKMSSSPSLLFKDVCPHHEQPMSP